MAMKTSDVKDVTIRMVGDVSKIGVGDTAAAGANGPDIAVVGSPDSIGNPTVEPASDVLGYVPSLAGIAPGSNKTSGPNPNLAQPACPKPADTVTLQQVTGKSVSFPAAADGASAGKPSSGQGLEGSIITGATVKFPVGADTSMQPKVVDSFGAMKK